MSETIVLGIDGGGTRTRAALVAAGGRLLGLGEGGPGNWHDVGREGLRDGIAGALAAARQAAGIAPGPLAAAFLGLGSVVTPADHRVVRRVARALDLAPLERIGVDHDLRIAHAGALAARPGIVLVAGTGSAAWGRTAAGESWKTGGWGPILDDVGSAHWLGHQALVAVARSSDGRWPATALRERVLEAVGVEEPRDLLLRVEARGLSRREVARLAPLVTRAAGEGDAVARDLLRRAAGELATLAATVAERLEFPAGPIPLAVTGGLLEAGPAFTTPLCEALARAAPRCRQEPARLSAVLGAAILALDLAGAPLEEADLERLAREEGP